MCWDAHSITLKLSIFGHTCNVYGYVSMNTYCAIQVYDVQGEDIKP